MPNGAIDGNNISKGDAGAEKSNIGGSGDTKETSLNLLADTMPTGSDAFGQKSDGKVDQQEQLDITESPEKQAEIVDDAENQLEGNDKPQELGKMMQESAKKAVESLNKAGDKAEQLKGTDQEDNVANIAEFFGEQAAKAGAAAIGGKIAAMNFKGAGSDISNIAGQAGKMAGKAAVDTKKE